MIKAKPFYYLLKKIEMQIIKIQANKGNSLDKYEVFSSDKAFFNIEFYLMDALKG